MTALVASLLMLAAFALCAGAVLLLVRGRERGKALLMLLAAAVMVGNVVILTG